MREVTMPDEESAHYSIEFSGDIPAPDTIGTVAEKLGQIFQVTTERALAFLKGGRRVVRRAMPAATAARYLTSLNETGAHFRLIRDATIATSIAPVGVASEPDAVASYTKSATHSPAAEIRDAAIRSASMTSVGSPADAPPRAAPPTMTAPESGAAMQSTSIGPWRRVIASAITWSERRGLKLLAQAMPFALGIGAPLMVWSLALAWDGFSWPFRDHEAGHLLKGLAVNAAYLGLLAAYLGNKVASQLGTVVAGRIAAGVDIEPGWGTLLMDPAATLKSIGVVVAYLAALTLALCIVAIVDGALFEGARRFSLQDGSLMLLGTGLGLASLIILPKASRKLFGIAWSHLPLVRVDSSIAPLEGRAHVAFWLVMFWMIVPVLVLWPTLWSTAGRARTPTRDSLSVTPSRAESQSRGLRLLPTSVIGAAAIALVVAFFYRPAAVERFTSIDSSSKDGSRQSKVGVEAPVLSRDFKPAPANAVNTTEPNAVVSSKSSERARPSSEAEEADFACRLARDVLPELDSPTCQALTTLAGSVVPGDYSNFSGIPLLAKPVLRISTSDGSSIEGLVVAYVPWDAQENEAMSCHACGGLLMLLYVEEVDGRRRVIRTEPIAQGGGYGRAPVIQRFALGSSDALVVKDGYSGMGSSSYYLQLLAVTRGGLTKLLEPAFVTACGYQGDCDGDGCWEFEGTMAVESSESTDAMPRLRLKQTGTHEGRLVKIDEIVSPVDGIYRPRQVLGCGAV